MRNVVIVVMITFLTACENHNITPKKAATETYVPLSDNYLPLAIGNYWDFETPGHSKDKSSTQIHREVTSIVTINNHQYYLLVSIITTNNYTFLDSSYYRTESNGFVYIYRKVYPNYEDNRFRLNGNDHDTWSYPVDGDYQAQVTLTVDTVTLGNVVINNTKNYYYDVAQWIDEEYTIMLAPGIGFIKEYNEPSGLNQELKSAKIGDHVFNF